mgnify:CR=1 FL=1
MKQPTSRMHNRVQDMSITSFGGLISSMEYKIYRMIIEGHPDVAVKQGYTGSCYAACRTGDPQKEVQGASDDTEHGEDKKKGEQGGKLYKFYEIALSK